MKLIACILETRITTIFVAGLLAFSSASADTIGAADHPQIPRVSGSTIVGYSHSEYDAGIMMVAGEKKPVEQNPEGTRTRILYLTKPGDTPLMVMKNYEVALADLGTVTEKYSCRNRECNAMIMSYAFWTRDTMISTKDVPKPFYLLGFPHSYGSPHYRYAEVVTDESKFHISVYAVVIADNNSNVDFRNRTVVLVEVLEIADFEPTLEFIDASQMQSELEQTGHIALYGIQFDNNEVTLKPDSQATLAEITKALNENSDLALYVVGHTDDVGALDYNNDLSQRRATTVVESLVASGIDQSRLTPVGVGPVAPIGSNNNDEGKALNRRVELVQRLR